MSQEIASVSGLLVAVTSYTYNSFKSADGSTVAGGTVYTAHIVKAFDQEPVSVKLPAGKILTDVEAAGFGAAIDCTYELRAKPNGRFDRRAIECEVTRRPGSPATNGVTAPATSKA